MLTYQITPEVLTHLLQMILRNRLSLTKQLIGVLQDNTPRSPHNNNTRRRIKKDEAGDECGVFECCIINSSVIAM